eukprot:gb/GFBE01052360.1/.p1 GENE.gb/GFBE01052360.1/~~gb/GFBE01052360.1/.p1  ORF type:complete len:211 (+),score=38.62 gb/GFBE01052360.1/:1-633(+)
MAVSAVCRSKAIRRSCRLGLALLAATWAVGGQLSHAFAGEPVLSFNPSLPARVSSRWSSNERRRIRLQSVDDAADANSGATAAGKLPTALVEGPLSKPGHFQYGFLEKFVEFAGERWPAGEAGSDGQEELPCDDLVAKVEAFQALGLQEMGLWNAYLEQELGKLIGDPYAFDTRIVISDAATRKAVRRAARTALLDSMLSQSKAKRDARS